MAEGACDGANGLGVPFKDMFDKTLKLYSLMTIRRFAERIDRDPGIVLGRLQNDQIVPFTNVALSKALKHKYKVITS